MPPVASSRRFTSGFGRFGLRALLAGKWAVPRGVVRIRRQRPLISVCDKQKQWSLHGTRAFACSRLATDLSRDVQLFGWRQ
jgi:hypothetical protein